MTKNIFFSLILLLGYSLLSSCSKKITDEIDESQLETSYFIKKINPFALNIDTTWNASTVSTDIFPILKEASGIVPSLENDSCYWINEDSGSPGRIFLYSESGNQRAIYNFKGFGVEDMEDLAYYFNKNNNKGYIYIGDFGDNNTSRADIKVLIIEDKKIAINEQLDADTVRILNLKYKSENGINPKFNCEAFICEPNTGVLYFFTKESSSSYIYRLSPPFDFEHINILEKIGEFDINAQKVTAADMSLNGNYFVLKTYEYIFIWQNNSNLDFEELLKEDPLKLPYQGEAQGEAFCFSSNADKYLTISELNNGIQPKLRINYKNILK